MYVRCIITCQCNKFAIQFIWIDSVSKCILYWSKVKMKGINRDFLKIISKRIIIEFIKKIYI